MRILYAGSARGPVAPTVNSVARLVSAHRFDCVVVPDETWHKLDRELIRKFPRAYRWCNSDFPMDHYLIKLTPIVALSVFRHWVDAEADS